MSKTTARKKAPDLQEYVFNIGKRCREWFLPLEGGEAEALRRRGVTVSGRSRLRTPYVMCRPRNPHYILLLPADGELQLTVPRRRKKIRAGEIWLMPPESLYRYELTRGTADMTWFHIDADIPLVPRGGEPLKLDWANEVIERMRFYFATLEQEAHHPDGELRRKLYELIDVELRRLPLAGHDPLAVNAVTRLRRVWEELERGLGAEWDVNAIAERTGLSASRFHALSVEHFGISPYEKLTRMRMSRACALLRLTPHKTDHIAAEVGYANAFAFSKAFKKTVGISPTAYREQQG